MCAFVPVFERISVCERSECKNVPAVQCERAIRCLTGALERIRPCAVVIGREDDISHRQSAVRLSIRRVSAHRIGEKTDRLSQPGCRPPIPEIETLQKRGMRFGILRLCSRQLHSIQLDAQLACDGPRNFVLHREHILHPAIVPLTPQYRFVRHRDEADRDSNLVSRALHTSLKHVRYTELARDLSGAESLVRESQCTASPDDVQSCSRQCTRDFLSQSFSEEIVRLVAAQVREREHCY